MPKNKKRKTGLIRGKSTAFLVSAGIHVALIVGAGTFVVFEVIKSKQVTFVPPPKQERKTMKLKKLRVKVKKNTRPKRQASRITSKTTSVMPDIQLPEMTGLGGGLSEGIGGFQIMADIENMSILGSKKSIGNDLVGTFYDLSRLKSGEINPGFPENARNTFLLQKVGREFVESEWDTDVFSKYWKSPKKLYATQFMLPIVSARIAPAHFGVSDKLRSQDWIIYYKGQIGSENGGRFRFWGVGDELFIAGINGEFVFDGCWGGEKEAFPYYTREDPYENRRHSLGTHVARVGSWFTLEPGEPADMELVIGEGVGGSFAMMLLIQQEGVDYPINEHGSPILPMFKTMPVPPHLVDEIEYLTVPGRMDITGGPIFGIY